MITIAFTRLWNHLICGGVVMIPIIIVSVWMWTMIIEKILSLRRMERDDLSLDEVLRMIGNPEGCVGDSGGMLAGLVREFNLERRGDPSIDTRILDQFALRQVPHLRRGVGFIGVLAAVEPLLGLLGTVTGMMKTFDIITLFGTGNAKAMAGGIAEAMITTQTGLVVAIPGLFMCVYLSRHSSMLLNRLDQAILTLKRSMRYD